MNDLLTRLCDGLARHEPLALATVLTRQGSTPRGAGSRLLADARGALLCGTVGGGLAEARVLELAQIVLRDGQSRCLVIDMSGNMAAQSEMICGGTLEVLVEPLGVEHLPLFQLVRDALTGPNQNGALLVRHLTAAPHRAVCLDGIWHGEPLPPAVSCALGSALPARAEAASAIIEVEGERWAVERWLGPPRLILAGGGHVSRPTAHIAALAGFAVTVLDDRPEFSRPDRFPKAQCVRTVPEFANCFSELEPDSRTCIVIITRGHLHDASVLAQALTTRAGYIGMIGSRRKRDDVYATLRAQGVPEHRLARVHCPVGLAIKAETPEEIAVSIVAECIAHRRGA